MAISKLNPSAGGIPFGDTAGRPTGATGKLYSNGETARLELYTSAGQWENIVQEVPGVTSISGQYLETNNSNTITIFGTNFVSGASAFAIGTNSVEVAATSTTFTSLVELSAVFTGLTAANEPYDIKVVNPSNLFGILPDTLFVNNQVTWTTSAGSLGTFAEQVSISVSAVASDDSTITYAVASGSTLPSGITLNTATGLLSGTLADVASNTTYTFTLTASDGSNPAVSRQFSIIANAAPVWVTSAGTLGTFSQQSSITLSALSATDSSDTVTYALASGSSLPSGISLNSSTGVISGTLPSVSVETTYTFTINALDGVNTIPRAFSITSVIPSVSGGTLTSDSTYYYRTFTSTGSLTVANAAVPVDILMVGAGGGGGRSLTGGGGGGAVGHFTSVQLSVGTNTVTIGAGGTTGGSGGSKGTATSLLDISVLGGGGAPNRDTANTWGQNNDTNGGANGAGSSADGASKLTSRLGISQSTPVGITGSIYSGFSGGQGAGQSPNYPGGGGGGANGNGVTPSGPSSQAGNGGPGKQIDFGIHNHYWAGGGGGSAYTGGAGGGNGGIGGGGGGASNSGSGGSGGGSALNGGESASSGNGNPSSNTPGGAGGVNTGGGGGGGAHGDGAGGTGGSGILIIKYLKSAVGG
jgi:hypothetical protein